MNTKDEIKIIREITRNYIDELSGKYAEFDEKTDILKFRNIIEKAKIIGAQKHIIILKDNIIKELEEKEKK